MSCFSYFCSCLRSNYSAKQTTLVAKERYYKLTPVGDLLLKVEQVEEPDLSNPSKLLLL